MRLAEYCRSAPFRIATAYAALFTLSVVAVFGVLLWSITREMTGQIEGAIERDMRPLVSAYRDGRIGRLVDAVQERADASLNGEAFYLLESRSGQVLAGNLDAVEPFSGWREINLENAGAPNRDHHSVRRVLALGVPLNGAFVFVGRNMFRITEVQETLLRSLGWAIVTTVLLALVGGAILSRGALRRVERIARATRSIVDGDLARRLPARARGDEIDLLARNINRMLDWIEELMEGLRQVTNDIAHDLRTPLSRLRQRLETAQRRERTVEGLGVAMGRAIEEIDAILGTFNALLRIAQIEAGARKAQFTRVDLSELARTIAEAYEVVAETEGQTLRATIADALVLHGDRDLLTQMLANLVENAIRHTPAGTTITLVAASGPDGTVIEVADDGPGIPADERDKVFERFYRLETSRTTPGSGLGLALVRAIAELHGAEVMLADNAPGLRVVLRFPSRRVFT